MSSRLRDQVELELKALERLLDEYTPLSDRPPEALNNFEIAACGAMLHSFYNGIENVLKRIVLAIDGCIPEGEASHRQLLAKVVQPAPRRTAVLSAELCDDLKDYLNFRHVFRSAYSFHLRWEKMEPLVTGARSIRERFEAEVLAFLDALSA